MPFLIHFYRRFTGKIASILHECFKRVALKLYHMKAHSLMFETVMYLRHLFQFLAVHGRLPIRPNTLFNDFLFQLKASSELGSPLRTFITDKELAKIYVEKKLGAGATPVTLCVLRTPEEVETYLPVTYPVVIKPTHSCSRIVLAFSESDYRKAKTQIKDWLNQDYFLRDLERNYAKLEKKIIVEKYIDDTFAIEGSVHCLRGEPKIISLIDRKTKERQSFDTNKSALGVSLVYPLKEFEPKDWGFLNSLLESSRILSGEFSYIRVDFYTDGERILIGELTNLPAGGTGQFFPAGGEKKFSEVFFSSWQK
jgi:teichuronopeptide biosynthesis TupA-like protein